LKRAKANNWILFCGKWKNRLAKSKKYCLIKYIKLIIKHLQMQENFKARIGKRGKEIDLACHTGEFFMKPKEGWEFVARLVEVLDLEKYFESHYPPKLKDFLQFAKKQEWPIGRSKQFSNAIEKNKAEGFTPHFRPMFERNENDQFIKIPNYVAIFRAKTKRILEK
jgi:hypothetical protein